MVFHAVQWPCACLQVLWQEVQPNSSINRHNKLVCGKPHQRKSFCHFSMWGKDHHWGDHPQSECVGGRGEEEDGSGQLQVEGRHPLPSQMENIMLFFNKLIFVFFSLFFVVSQDFKSKLILNVAINNHIILLLYKENIHIWDSSLKEDVKCLPSHQHVDNQASRKAMRVLPAIT